MREADRKTEILKARFNKELAELIRRTGRVAGFNSCSEYIRHVVLNDVDLRLAEKAANVISLHEYNKKKKGTSCDTRIE